MTRNDTPKPSDCPDAGYDLKYIHHLQKQISTLNNYIDKNRSMNIEDLKNQHAIMVDTLDKIDKCRVKIEGKKELLRLPNNHKMRLFYERGELEQQLEEAQQELAELETAYYVYVCLLMTKAHDSKYKPV